MLAWIKKNKIEFLLLALILLVSAFMRLYRIEDYLIFLGDEGRDVLVVKRMIVDHKFTLLGPTASIGGFYLGPIYYYFMAPFLWLFRLNPVGPAVMVALFGIATVFLVYRVGRDFFEAKVGLLAAALYAISPFIISYSRSSWNPNLMPFFSLLIIWILRRAVKEENNQFLGLTGFLLGITLQLHYLATFLGVIIGIYFFIFSPQRKNLKSYFWLIGGFVVGWSPFLLFELRHNFPNLRTLYYFLTSGKETGFVAKKFWPIISSVLIRLFSRLVTGDQIFLGKILLCFSSLIFGFYWLRQKKNSPVFKTYSLVIIWFLMGVFLFGFYQNNVHDYYLGFLFTLPFLLIAFLLTKISRVGKVGLYLVVLLTLYLFWINLRGNPFRRNANRQLAQTRKMAQFIMDKTEEKPYNFALISSRNTDHAYRYFLEVWRKPPRIIENPYVDPERKTVTDQLLVACEDFPCSPIGNPLWEIAGFGMAKIENQWEAYGLKLYKLIHLEEGKK